MTDITRTLEMFLDIGKGGGLISASKAAEIFAEALAEIQRLRQEGTWRDRGMYVYPVDLSQVVWPNTLSVIDNPPVPPAVLAGQDLRILSRPNGSFVAEQPIGDGIALNSMAHPEPTPDPWGSPFAMNTENWK
jgi:hypothetical protein